MGKLTKLSFKVLVHKVNKLPKLKHTNLKITCDRKAVHIIRSQNIDKSHNYALKNCSHVYISVYACSQISTHRLITGQSSSVHFVIKELP